MKKILLVSNHGLGFYNFKKELVDELAERGFEVHFAVPFHGKIKELLGEQRIYHELNIDRRGVNPIKDLSLMKQLWDVTKKAAPDAIVFHTIKPNIYGSLIAKKLKIPYFNNITGLGSALQGGSGLAGLLEKMYRAALNSSCGVFFENEGNKDFFIQKNIIDEEKAIVVSGAGVNTEYYAPEKIEHDGLNFLFIARIMREKGAEEFLSAAAMIKDKYEEKKIQFQILGDYEDIDLKEMVEEYEKKGIVKYLGVSNDTRREMAQADCIVLPSYHEGMSNVLLEGASFGIPLITTNIHGCKEAVEDGVSGLLCRKGDAEDLKQCVEKIILMTPDEREAMGWNGRKRMQKYFQRSDVVNRYIQEIEKVL